MKVISAAMLTLVLFKTNAQNMGDTLLVTNNRERIVFIDHPNSRWHHKALQALSLNHGELETRLTMRQKAVVNEWMTIRKYKGKYYAYHPSEPYANTLIQQYKNELVINVFGDGIVTYRVKKKNVTSQKIELHLAVKDGFRNTITITHGKENLVWITSSLFNTKKPIAFTTKQSFFRLPIIVNYSPNARCEEFVFDE